MGAGMMPYPNAVNTPSRKQRKAQRNKVFITNKKANKLMKKARRKELSQ